MKKSLRRCLKALKRSVLDSSDLLDSLDFKVLFSLNCGNLGFLKEILAQTSLYLTRPFPAMPFKVSDYCEINLDLCARASSTHREGFRDLDMLW